ncbi:Sodium channel protein 60E [Madurella mycetomatis]|uniref:Sodium channel protein 60E n=1 Tax=Madurella mycetomatis TaxID=100816 RepID=A0A175VPG9_9PEZI|nr:Sodium channel protein 60E [Madurella mycetomatis]
MADLGLPHNHLATLLNALTSIDRRLSRIEASLRISNFNPNVAPTGASSSSTPSAALQASVHQAGPIPTAPPPQPTHNHNHNHTHTHAPQNHRQAQPQTAAPPAPGHVVPAHDPGSAVAAAHLLGGAPATATAAVTPLEPPPQGYTISSRATMQEELDQWTLPRGYSMRIAGAKVTGKRKVRWVCFRGGEARHHRAPVDEAVLLRAKAEGRRKPTTDRTSKKCGCLFKFEVIETAKDSDVWVLHYPNEEHKVHNHGPSDQTSDPRARKLPSFMSAEVDQWLRDGWLVSKIQEELKAEGFTECAEHGFI